MSKDKIIQQLAEIYGVPLAVTRLIYENGATDQQSTFEAQLEEARREGFNAARITKQIEVETKIDRVPALLLKLVPIHETEDDYINSLKQQEDK